MPRRAAASIRTIEPVILTRATLRSAEFGFFGVVV